MKGSPWKFINERIKNCRSLQNTEKVIKCLKELFQTTNDGMVAYALGEEYEKLDSFVVATKYYEIAETLFPLPNYKAQAREGINRLINKTNLKKGVSDIKEETLEEVINRDLSKLVPSDTLLIVSCTKKKIWDYNYTAPDFVPARYVYKGTGFINVLSWLENYEIESKGFFWIILSGKYGFIEPWHPISRYDVNLSNLDSYPISDETLKNQVKQKKLWRNKNGELIEVRIIDFHNLILINLSGKYCEKVMMCLPKAKVKQVIRLK